MPLYVLAQQQQQQQPWFQLRADSLVFPACALVSPRDAGRIQRHQFSAVSFDNQLQANFFV
jgi:hypothetical protein